MNIAAKKVHEIVQNPWLNLIITIITIISFGYLLYDKSHKEASESLSWIPLVIFTISICIFSGFSFYSLRVKKSLSDFNQIPHHLHRINHVYRDSLSRICGNHEGEESIINESVLKQEQLTTLTSVCDHISDIFERLIGKECQVAIKLLNQDEDGFFCETYTRSRGISERDSVPPKKFRVLTGQNTAFDRALLVNAGTKPSHFWSPDLGKEKDYHNQRQKYLDCYKSAIVVPIRYIIPEKRGQKDGTDDIGFLCVDTKSKNRLNDGSHVECVASFADQMYNYISIMSKSYCLTQQGATS